jgi:putative spermidine/putrescine transport system permease protein
MAAGRTTRRRVKAGSVLLWVVLALALIYLILPLIATLGFSVAKAWNRTVFPDGYTFQHYTDAVKGDLFRPTVMRTLKLVLFSSILSPLIVTPAVLYVHLKVPKFKPWLEFLSIVPWALPGVVLALAMIRAYISPYNADRRYLLVLTYVLISLPFMFRAIDAGLSPINAKTLVEAANVLGAGWFDVTLRVLIPNVMSGILSGALLVAALAAGEYALAALMVGPGWKTYPVYQAQMQGTDGRIGAAMAILGLIFTFTVSLILIYITTRNQRSRNVSTTATAIR